MVARHLGRVQQIAQLPLVAPVWISTALHVWWSAANVRSKYHGYSNLRK